MVTLPHQLFGGLETWVRWVACLGAAVLAAEQLWKTVVQQAEHAAVWGPASLARIGAAQARERGSVLIAAA